MGTHTFPRNSNTPKSYPSFLFGSSPNSSQSSLDEGARPYGREAGDYSGSVKNKFVHWSPSLQQPNTSQQRLNTSLSESDIQIQDTRPGPPRRLLQDHSRIFELSSADQDPITPGSLNTSSVCSFLKSDLAEGDHVIDCCVTVFGFGREDISFVLELFSRHGTIVAHRFPNRGNWVHLRYACAVHAQQALSRNGKVVDGRLRLGVMPVDQTDIPQLEGPVWFAADNTGSANTSVVNHSQDLEDLSSSVVSLERSIRSTASRFTPLRANIDPFENCLEIGRVAGDNNTGEAVGLLEKLWSYIY